jgi:hypothetical protein
VTSDSRSAAERLLDQAIELTFPASDPISVDSAFHRASGPEKAPAGPDNPGEAEPRVERKPRQD